MTEEEKPVVVFETADPIDVDLARGLLETAGIPFVEKGRGGVGAMEVLTGPQAKGLRSLTVPAEYEQRARDVLARMGPQD